MYYNNIPLYNNNMYNQNFRRPQNFGGQRVGSFLFPFALGFVSSPLLFGATNPRPPYYGPYPPYPGPYPYPYR